MLTYRLSAFADEISPDLEEQFDVLERNGIHSIEFRGVWHKNVLDLDDAEVQRVEQRLRDRGFTISAIGSPIGKVKIDDDFDAHLQRFRRALELAHRFQTPYIRIFSFFLPNGQEPARFRDEVLRRMGALCDAAARFDSHVILLHENEKEIYGDTAERCRDLVTTLGRPNLQITFDPANFIQVKVRPFTEAYPLLVDHIRYVHIKDARWDDGGVVPAGEGDGDIAPLIAALSERNYSGFLSIEPHLALAGRHGGFTGADLFARAVDALKRLLDDPATARPVSC